MEDNTAAAAAAAGGMDGGMRMMSPPPPSGGMIHGLGGMGGGGMTMHMTFFWGSHVQILLSGWPGDRGLGYYILALLLVLAASVLVEALSSLSRRLERSGSERLLLTVVHAVRMGLAYLVMLAVMSFNVGVLIAAIAGHGLGFLVCRSGIFGRGKTLPDGHDSLHFAVPKH